MTTKAGRKQAGAIARAGRISTRQVRRIFLRNIAGQSTFSQGLRKWAGSRRP